MSNGAPTVTLSNPTAAKPTFTAPRGDGAGRLHRAVQRDRDQRWPEPRRHRHDGDAGDASPSRRARRRSPRPRSRAPAAARRSSPVTRSPWVPTITNPDGTNPADYTYVWSQSSGVPTTLSSTTVGEPDVHRAAERCERDDAACTSGTGATSPTSANCPEFKVIVTKINTGKASAQSALAANYAASLADPPGRERRRGPERQGRLGHGHARRLGLDAGAGSPDHLRLDADRRSGGDAVEHARRSSRRSPRRTRRRRYTFSLTVDDTQSPIIGHRARTATRRRRAPRRSR